MMTKEGAAAGAPAVHVKETPVETKMRKVLVNTAVRHALRCVQVAAEDRAALVVQRNWRCYAASRELRRRRWAARRKRWGKAGVATLLAAPFSLVRAVLRAVSFAFWSFLMTFWFVRTIVWFVASIPRALFHALVSWEAVVGAGVATALARRDGSPEDMGFQDYFAMYVVGFVLLDICARDYLVKPVVAAGAAARRGAAAVTRFTLMTAARMSPTRAGEVAIHRVAKLLGLIQQMPQKYRVMHFATPPPLVMPVMKKKVEDPELLDALKTAEIFARESKSHAEQLEGKLEEIEEKLRTFTSLSEAQMAAAKEISKRALETAMQEATTRLASTPAPAPAAAAAADDVDASASLTLVEERIDKRFEDMEAMLQAARDEGRAEGVRESSAAWLDGEDTRNLGRHSFDRPPLVEENLDDLAGAAPATVTAIERGLKEGMERGIMKGIQLEKMRKKQKSWKPAIKKMLGWESKKGPDGLSKKKAAQSSLNELKMAIRKKSLQLDKK
jgi:hypothetical protein